MNAQPPIALTIASSDSGGGAGVQADLKAFARCGVHGTSVIVALTAQNTTGVRAIHPCPPDFVIDQVESLFADLRPAAIKLGMLFSAEIVNAVADAASSAARPKAATSVWTTQPASAPEAAARPAAMPRRSVCARANIMSTPGVALTTKTVAAKTPSECVPSIAPAATG